MIFQDAEIGYCRRKYHSLVLCKYLLAKIANNATYQISLAIIDYDLKRSVVNIILKTKSQYNE